MSSAGGSKYQYLAALSVNIISISYGAFCGWPSSSFLELTAEDSPLDTGPLTSRDQGWVASNICLGGLFGTLLFTWLADKIGRKWCLMWMALPNLLGWVIIPFARNPMHLIIARFIGGAAGGGCFTVIPIYIAELASDNIRGTLGVFLVLTCNAGVVLAFVLGYYFNYAQVSWIVSSLSFVFVGCFWFMPETPQHLAKINKIEEAERSLRYYRNIKTNPAKELSEELQLELQKLRTTEKSDADADGDDNEATGVTWADFAEGKTRKAFLIGFGLISFNQLCGCFAMLNYTAEIFKQAGSSIEPTMAAIIVGFIQLLGTYTSTVLVERLGRKLLLLVSAVGIGLGQSAMGIYSYFQVLGWHVSTFSWVPIAGFSFMLFLAAVGLLSLPFLVISEIMPQKIRSTAIMLLMSVLWLISTCAIKLIPAFIESLGMHGTVFMFASLSFSAAVFIAVFVPETKGKSVEAILASL
ncbi:LOW QUALITY PROTEIN: facilitated trehalose transporter Tret1 [Drosophila eugracilis]|uniref:LOW QUALITY PROTEIN: facilitated trehalose transporter Tret1 n=1 Tax=Drosophila eugracilis TaxID=29029 RepID=UPI001BD92247|nr:LOW QUALITY PROTEIN: facilitated trehalose transporter Tret1 [Drosophila eugracilis]